MINDDMLKELKALQSILGDEPTTERQPGDLEDEQIAEYYGIHMVTVQRRMKNNKEYKKVRVYDPEQDRKVMVWRKI